MHFTWAKVHFNISLKKGRQKNSFIKKLNYRRIAGSGLDDCVLITYIGTEQTPLNSVSHWRQFTLVTDVSHDLHQHMWKRNSLWQFWTCHILISVFLSYRTGRGEASASSISVSGVSRWATPFGGGETKTQAHQLLAQSHSWNSCRWWNKTLVSWFLGWYFSHCLPWGIWSGLLWRLLSIHYVKPAVKKHSLFPPTACCNLSGEHPARSTAVPTAGSLPVHTPSSLTLAFPSLPPQPQHPAACPSCPSPLLPPFPPRFCSGSHFKVSRPPRKASSFRLAPLQPPWHQSSWSRYEKSPTCSGLCTPRAILTCRYLFDTEMPSWFGFSDEHFKVFLRTWVVRHELKKKQTKPVPTPQVPNCYG